MQVTAEASHLKRTSYLYTQSHLLKLVLMWPITAQTKFKKIIIHLYFYGLIATLAICSVGLSLKVLFTSDLVDRSEAIDILTLTFTGMLKILYFAYRHKDFEKLVDFADNEFRKSPFFGNENFSTDKWMRWCSPLSIMHSIMAFLLISFWGICPILKYLFGLTTYQEMSLPMNVWYPFDYHSNIRFEIMYLIHYFGLIAATNSYMACDGFFFSLIHLSYGQIKIIKASLRGLKNITPRENETSDEAQYRGLKQCVEHHSKILYFLRELDLILRSMIVNDILHAIISLSFAMLQTSESKGVLENLKMFFFISYCFLHQYLNSFFGQNLINQQESLLNEIYDIDWISSSNSLKKALLIMMSATAKPVKFSAWRMYFLQYETFLEFCKTMISFYMVLRTIRDQSIS